MENLKQPKPMIMEGDLALNWKKFKQAFQLYLTATGGIRKDDEVQAAVLLHCIGEEAMELFEILGLTEEQKNRKDDIMEKFESYFISKTNPSMERHRFNMRTQGPQEKFDEFLKKLKTIAASCEFGDLKDSLIKDRIVCGVQDRRVKDRLLREDNLTLVKAVDICKAAEMTDKHLRDMYDQQETAVNAVISGQSTAK